MDNVFDKMFKHAEKFSLEDFTDEDLAAEGIITAKGGDMVRDVTDGYREIKGWFQGMESKRRNINELCQDTIDWLKDEDRDNPRLSLDMGTFKTWMKTSETFYWRYYFVLSEQVFKETMKQIKDNDISTLEALVDFDIVERMKVTKMLDSVRTVKDLIVIMEKYRSRCNMLFEGLSKRERRIQSFPFQILLLGYNDLNRTVKKIVNLAL